MTDKTRPVSSSNRPESFGTNATEQDDVIPVNLTPPVEPNGSEESKEKAKSKKPRSRTVDIGANPK